MAVFKLPRDNSTDYIKRAIGLPIDEIIVRVGWWILICCKEHNMSDDAKKAAERSHENAKKEKAK